LNQQNKYRLSKYLETPKLTYDSKADIVNVKPGHITLFDSIDSFTKIKRAAKVYPKLSDYLCSILGIRARETASIKEKTNTSRGGYFSLLVYSNIVKHQLVGDTVTQLLRLVHIPSTAKFGDQVTITYEKPQFFPLTHNYFKNIEILVCDDTGRKIPFQFGRTYVTLVFKRDEDPFLI